MVHFIYDSTDTGTQASATSAIDHFQYGDEAHAQHCRRSQWWDRRQCSVVLGVLVYAPAQRNRRIEHRRWRMHNQQWDRQMVQQIDGEAAFAQLC
jgi:hypothetical protein